MIYMKCPICGKQMKIGTLDTDDGMGTVWMSIMPCDCVCSYGASKAVWQELIKVIEENKRTRKALDKGMKHITGLNNMIESWLNLINSDLDQETKLRILKSAISAYVENKGSDNEK